MSRLIDADKLLKKAITVENVNATGRTKTMVDANDIDNAPTIDAEPVVHSHWILESEPNGKPYCYHCSNCDRDFHHISIKTAFPFCPNCGAKMDKEKEEK